MHPRVLRDLDRVVAKLLPMIFGKSWQLEVPGEQKKASIVPIFKKLSKNPVNCQSVSPTSVPENHGTDPPRMGAKAHG